MELALAAIPDIDLGQSVLRADVVASIAALSGLALVVVAGWVVADLVAPRRANDDLLTAPGQSGPRGAHREPERPSEQGDPRRQTRPIITGRNAHRTSPITCHGRTARFT
jgi:hypothetical protein